MPIIAANSSVRGFLVPGSSAPFAFDSATLGFDAGFWDNPAPLAGQDLEDFLQQIVAGVSGLPGRMTRPRWQEEPPNIPGVKEDWVSIGITSFDPTGMPYGEFDGSGDMGQMYQQSHEEFDLMCSFYGPNSDRHARLFRTGIYVPQNREALSLASMGLVRVGGMTAVPSLIKNTWYRRIDQTVRFRRAILEVYPVLYLLEASAQVNAGA